MASGPQRRSEMRSELRTSQSRAMDGYTADILTRKRSSQDDAPKNECIQTDAPMARNVREVA
eukprot:scaffold3768_cov376-Prasinococcus_capsulatus_cf.AAC.32